LGQLDQDFTHYWFQSEQLTTIIGMAVKVEHQSVRKAFGILVQEIAGATSEELKSILFLRDQMPELLKAAEDTQSFVDALNHVIPNHGFRVVEDNPVRFQCNCSLEKVEESILLTGPHEVQELIKEGKDVVARCEFCNDEFTITVSRLKEMLGETRH
jgi:molecular chaperone Hsp33